MTHAGMFRPLGIWIRRMYDLAAHLDHLGYLAFGQDLLYPGNLGHLASHLRTPYPQSPLTGPLRGSVSWALWLRRAQVAG